MARIERYTSPDKRCRFDLHDDGSATLRVLQADPPPPHVAARRFRQTEVGVDELALSPEHVGFLMAALMPNSPWEPEIIDG